MTTSVLIPAMTFMGWTMMVLVIFYMLSVIVFITQRSWHWFVPLAWTYVGLRKTIKIANVYYTLLP